MSNFDKRDYAEKIKYLTEKAKTNSKSIGNLDIGELFYVELLKKYIMEFRSGDLTTEQLDNKKKELENALLKYYQWGEIFDYHTKIRNKCSHILTIAEKCGCETCKELVRAFEGRDLE